MGLCWDILNQHSLVGTIFFTLFLNYWFIYLTLDTFPWWALFFSFHFSFCGRYHLHIPPLPHSRMSVSPRGEGLHESAVLFLLLVTQFSQLQPKRHPFTTWLWRAAGRLSPPSRCSDSRLKHIPTLFEKEACLHVQELWPEGQALRSLWRCSQGS